MKKVFLGLFIITSISKNLIAQPHELEGNWNSGSFNSSGPILTDRGVIRATRVQASGTATREFLFNNSGSNYNPQWTGSTGDYSRSLNSKLSGKAFHYSSGGWNRNLEVSMTDGNYYTFIVGENPGSNNDMSILETSYNPITVTTIVASPSGNPVINQPVELSITTSGTPDANEYIFVRYTTNSWSSSSFVQATGSGTSWSATIPGQSSGQYVEYYVLTTKSSITLTHSDADYQSLELITNGGSNWNFTVQTAKGNKAAGGSCDGTWGDADCWHNGTVPANSDNISILTNTTLDQDRTLTGTLTLAGGLLALGSNNLTIGSSATISGTPSSSTMIVTNGTGELRKEFSASGSFTFPIGDNTGSAEYSPITLNFTSGSFSSAYAGVKVIDDIYSNFIGGTPTDYVSRYWGVTQSGISSFSCDVSASYLDADVVGTESNIYFGKYTSGTWTAGNPTNTSNNILSMTATSFSDFGGGQLSSLPVQLINLKAAKINNTAYITWATANELNNDYFSIERQLPNGEFLSIGKIKGYGNSNALLNYSFTDKSPQLNSMNFYRVIQKDYNGLEEFFGPVSVNMDTENTKITTWPSPFENTLTISKPSEVILNKILVANMLGKIIWEQTISEDDSNSSFNIKTDTWVKGHYFITLFGPEYYKTLSQVKF